MKNEKKNQLCSAIRNADCVVIGAGAGFSTSAGFVYDGERFKKYFSDFEERYGFHDMYSGGFYPYKTQEEFWAYWSRYIYVNRYMESVARLQKMQRRLSKLLYVFFGSYP